MGVSRAFLRPEPLKLGAYAKLPDAVEQENAARGLLKPLYGLSTACKDWYETIRDFLANECGVCVGVTSLDKSVFFRPQRGFGYGYGGDFRYPNSPNQEKGIFGGKCEFRDYRTKKSTGRHIYTRRRSVNSRG